MSVEQSEGELPSRRISLTTRIAKRDLQTRLCGLLSTEQDQAESRLAEGETSVQKNGDEVDLRSAACSAPPIAQRRQR